MKTPLVKAPIAFVLIISLILGGTGIWLLIRSLREPSGTGTESDKLSVSDTVVEVDGVKVCFGSLLDEGEELLICEVEPENSDPDIEIAAYDFILSSGQPKGAIEIVIQYDDKDIPEEEEGSAVCGKYLDPDSGDWEDVFYFIDTEKNQIHIITDHFSTYGVFTVRDRSKRSAYISAVDVYAATMTSQQAMDILEKFTEQGPSWKEDIVKSALDIMGGTGYFAATSVPTLLSLGGAYDNALSSALGDSLTVMSVAASCSRFAFDAYYNGTSAKETSISGMKAVLDLAVNLGTPSIQLAYIGVGVIDLALSEVSTYAVHNKYKSTKNMYDAYYRRNGISRKLNDWEKLFNEIYTENKSDPKKALELIEGEINRYSNEYWEKAGADWESWIDSYDSNGKLSKYPWPSQKDRENISNIHRSELISYLTSLFISISRNMNLDTMEERRKDFQKVADLYNSKFTVDIKESVPSDEKPTWGGYYACIAPISGQSDPNAWMGKLSETGSGRISFTLLAHQSAGFPMKLELYKRASDMQQGINRVHSVDLLPFNESVQNVILQPRKIQNEDEPDPEITPDITPEATPQVTIPMLPEEEDPWYDVVIRSADPSKSFRGWYAVLGYPKNSSFALNDMYSEFNSSGECILSFQKSDYDSLGSPSHIWLYRNVTDLLDKRQPNQLVGFSPGSGSYAGKRDDETLYRIVIKAVPKNEDTDFLESITGIYESCIIHDEMIMDDLPEGKIENDYGPWEKPSADVELHYNGPTLTFISKADPYNTGLVLEKLSDNIYELTKSEDEKISITRVEIISTGYSAKVYTYYESPGMTLINEYLLQRK
jgi:hypothetical protein